MGKWSEERAAKGDHSVWRDITGEQNEMSGEVGDWSIAGGLRVGVCGSLSVLYESSCCSSVVPRGSMLCRESHTGWCALKSPRMNVLCCASVLSWSICGEYCGGHEELGGMYILMKLYDLLWSLMATDCSSSVLSCGRS